MVSRALAPHFGAVLALDPSPGMVAQARELNAADTTAAGIEVRQGSAEDLSPLRDGSIDCVVAGQAAHWFDYGRAWPELARVAVPGATLAFWGYKDHVIVGRPATSEVFDRFTYGKGEVAPGMESMARFWELPGRNILRNSLSAVVPPEKDWEDVRRIVWDPDRETAEIGDAAEEVLWMRKTLKLGELEGYTRTYSAFGGWKDAHPEFRSRADGGEGDIVDRMYDEVVAAVPEWEAEGNKWREIEVEAVWGTVLLLARRR